MKNLNLYNLGEVEKFLSEKVESLKSPIFPKYLVNRISLKKILSEKEFKDLAGDFLIYIVDYDKNLHSFVNLDTFNYILKLNKTLTIINDLTR